MKMVHVHSTNPKVWQTFYTWRRAIDVELEFLEWRHIGDSPLLFWPPFGWNDNNGDMSGEIDEFRENEMWELLLENLISIIHKCKSIMLDIGRPIWTWSRVSKAVKLKVRMSHDQVQSGANDMTELHVQCRGSLSAIIRMTCTWCDFRHAQIPTIITPFWLADYAYAEKKNTAINVSTVTITMQFYFKVAPPRLCNVVTLNMAVYTIRLSCDGNLHKHKILCSVANTRLHMTTIRQ